MLCHQELLFLIWAPKEDYWLLERKFRWFLYGWINSLRYVGGNPFKTLYIRSSILNLIRLCTVSQWKSFNIGVVWSFTLESVTTLAAVFCIHWRGSIWYKGRPNSNLLQLHRQELTNAWTRRSVVSRSRCFLIFSMLRRGNKALLQILLMWDLRFMCLSKKTPKSFTWPCGSIVELPTLTSSVLGRLREKLENTWKISVLESFRIRKFSTDHDSRTTTRVVSEN